MGWTTWYLLLLRQNQDGVLKDGSIERGTFQCTTSVRPLVWSEKLVIRRAPVVVSIFHQVSLHPWLTCACFFRNALVCRNKSFSGSWASRNKTGKYLGCNAPDCKSRIIISEKAARTWYTASYILTSASHTLSSQDVPKIIYLSCQR
jgi:hypothetical protein